jgi:excinuclease UvrABC ATPase subunit
MVKSPVEGSTLALIRLQSPVVYSDFVRPICLPDDDFAKNSILTDYPINSALLSANLVDQPRAEKFFGKIKKKMTFKEDRQFFKLSDNEMQTDIEEENDTMYEVIASELVDEHMNSLKPEAQFQPHSINYYAEQNQKKDDLDPMHHWTQCNTLGWSRQKEHLQRVQLNMIDMKACENISITTVNSLCAEAAYHKQNDCNEEEFAGAPILCLLTDEKRWSIVGVSNYRIACTHSGTERPRMYDKVESNVSWIREIINSVIS